MKILIPTTGRGTVAQQRTLELFPSATLVVDSPADVPPNHVGEVLQPEGVAGRGIRAKRQWILEQFWDQGKFVMFDDDLVFREQLRPGPPLSRPLRTPEDAQQLIGDLSRALDTYPLAGLAISFRLHQRPFPEDIASSFIHVAAFNRDARENVGQFRPEYRVEVSEDHDVNFQFLARGIPTVCLTRYFTVDKPHAPGGFSELRTPELIRESVQELVRHWGNRYVVPHTPERPHFQFKRLFAEAPLREPGEQK